MVLLNLSLVVATCEMLMLGKLGSTERIHLEAAGQLGPPGPALGDSGAVTGTP